MNVSKSLFSLVKYNGGEFKSQKQAAFINSQAVDGVIRCNQQFTFGEFNGCTRSITWMFFVNMEGIQKVIKMNNNGQQSVYWENTQEYKAEMSIKANKSTHNRMIADKMNHLSARARRNTERLEHIETTVKADLMEAILAGTDNPQVIESATSKIKRIEDMKMKVREVYNINFDKLEKQMIK